jgi:hypothetical protein
MITVKVENLHLHVTVQNDEPKLAEILTQLAGVRKDIKEFRDAMKLTDQELTDLLNGIDKTTNHTADNVATIATASAAIKTEMDAFIAAAPAGTTLSDAQVEQLQSLATRSQQISDAADAQVAVLQGVAAEGQPVVTPPPAPVVIDNPPQP